MLARIAIFIGCVAALAAIGQIPVAGSAGAGSDPAAPRAQVIEIPVHADELSRCRDTLQAVFTAPVEEGEMTGAPDGGLEVRCVLRGSVES